MSYGLKYTVQFSSIGTNQNYKFEILEKDYSGNYYSLLASSSPVKHGSQVDEPKSAIKGSSLTLTYVNEGGNPLNSFYSPDDTKYKGILYWGNQRMFEGFMVQDDSSEIIIDYRHEVSLSFNDGLGLLKDITLDLAFQPGLNPNQTTTDELYEFKTLLDIIKHCLFSTGLTIYTQLFEQIFENDQINYKIFLQETSVNMETFLVSDNNWDNCYTVLEKILGWYKLTLFQSKGMWCIVRWDDLRYYSGVIPGYQFDDRMVLQGYAALDNPISFGAPFVSGVPTGQVNNAVSGIQNRILRPYKFVKSTFNYKRPTNFKNADFLQLGDLIRQYTGGSGTGFTTTYEYVAKYWTRIEPGEIFIRVIKNYINVEIERYLVIKTTGTFSALTLAAESSRIEVSESDFASISFNVRCSDFPVTSLFAFKINNSPGIYRYAKDAPLGWYNGFWASVALQDGQWNSVEINPQQNLPFDGLLSFFPASLMGPVNGETHYKDIRLTYDIKINESINIIGHIHKDLQPNLVIKNDEDTEIFVDDSPKNSILGTTFNAGQDIGYLHKRTKLWYQGATPSDLSPIGKILTFEQLFWRRIPRTILEGTINGISDGTDHVTPLTRITNDQLPGLNFIFGRWEIDYRNNEVSGTLWEMYQDGEVNADLTHDYTFEYIYKTDT